MLEKTQEVKHVLPRTTDYFRIKSGKNVYKLMDKLSPSMTQDKLAEFYESENEKGNPLPLNSIQVMELLEDAVNSKNNELKNYIYKSSKNHWINTLTRVIYNPIKKDETIHNYGTSEAYSIIRDIVGDNNWIERINNKNALETLLKTKDVKKLNKISKAIDETPMYIWRLDFKPLGKTERAVGFNFSGGRLVICASVSLFDQGPAFLVEKVE